MSFVRVNPGDLIQAHQLNQVIDALDGVAGAGQPIQLISLNDQNNYALSVENLDATNSRALNVVKSDGTLLIRADVTGVTLGTPLNLTPNSVAGAALVDASVTNAKLGPDVARANLLTNGGFEIWQRGNGPFTVTGSASAYTADRWACQIGGGAGGTISSSRDTTNQDVASKACLALTYSSAAAGDTTPGVYQGIMVADGLLPQLGTRTVTFSIRIRTTTANFRPFIQTVAAKTFGSAVTADGAYHTVTMSATPGATDAFFYVGAEFTPGTGGVAYIDNAMLVVGSQPANYVPLHPADDLARCLRYYEYLVVPNTNLSYVGVGQAISATGAYLALPYKVSKPITPTITVSSPSHFGLLAASSAYQVATAIAPATQTTQATGLNVTVASGLVGGNAALMQVGSASGSISVEANP